MYYNFKAIYQLNHVSQLYVHSHKVTLIYIKNLLEILENVIKDFKEDLPTL